MPVTFTEGAIPAVLTGNIDVSDIDNTNIESAMVTISGNFVSTEDLLNFTNQSGITGIYDAASGSLSLTGTATLAQYQTALQTITYANTSDNPTVTTRTVSFSINDGDVSSNILTRDIEIEPANDAPEIPNIEVQPALFIENGMPVALTSGIDIADADDTEIDSATVTISDNFDANEDLLSFTTQNGITGNYDKLTGELILTGSATLDDYQSALRSITYTNTSDNPTTLSRTISFSVNDGDINSNVAIRSVNITPVNDAPALSSIEAMPATFTEGGSSTVLTGSINVSDIDDASIESATVAITTNFVSAEDLLSFRSQNGIIGAYNAATGILSLTGNATLAQYQAVLHSVAYSNNSENPSAAPRTVSFTINDGDTNSNTLLRNIDITPVNDAPVLTTIEIPPVSFTEDGLPAVLTSSINIADADDINIESATVSITNNFTDSEDLLNFIDQNEITGAYDTTTGILSLTGSATVADYQTALRSVTYANTSDNPTILPRTVSFIVNDGDDDALSETRNIDIIPVNDPPQATNGNVTATEDTPFIFSGAHFGFSDPADSNNFAAIIVNTLPAAGSLELDGIPVSQNQPISITDITNNKLVYTPAPDQNGVAADTWNFSVIDNGGIANGGNDTSTQATMTINILPVNDAPSVANSNLAAANEDSTPAGQTVNQLFASSFSDPDATDTLAGIAVTNNPQNAAEGQWQYAVAGGTWQSIGPASSTNALLLDSNTAIRFLPTSNYNGTPQPLQVNAVDSAYTGSFSAAAQVFADIANVGTSVSSAVSLNTTITAVNDAPIIADAVISPQNEETTSPIKILDLFAAQYSDVDGTNAIAGIAVTANTATASQGTWQYSTDGTNWQNINSVSNSVALVLDENSLVRFSPALNFNGTPGDLLVRAIDGTYTGATTTDNANRITFDTGSSGTLLSAEHSISITVLPVNDAPQGTDGTVVTNEDTAYTFEATDFGYSDPVELNNFAAITVDSVPASGMLTLNNVLVSQGDLISITDINAGLLVYTPLTHQNGVAADTWDFSVRDNGGIANGGLDEDQSSNTISIDITAINDAPQGSNGFVPTIEGVPGTLLIQDFGYSDPVDDHTFSAIKIDSITGPGTLTLNGTPVSIGDQIPASLISAGQLEFVAPLNSGSNQSDITFRVIDNGGTTNGGQDTSVTSSTLSIGITPPPNTPPQSADNTISLREDTVYSFVPTDFAFTDPVDGHGLQSVLIVTTPATGTLALNNTEVLPGDVIDAAELIDISFTPEPNAFGAQYATFDFQVIDNGTLEGGGSNIAANTNTITLDVTAVNDAPTATDNMLQTVETNNIQLTTTDFGFSDSLDQHSLQSITITSLPSSGQLQLGQTTVIAGATISSADIVNGQLIYIPAPTDTANSDQFEFTVTDNGGTANGGVDTSATANTISIAISPDNTPPTGQDAERTINEDDVLLLTSDTFGYSDDDHVMAGVIITTLPQEGDLLFNNAEVEVNDFISTSELEANLLTYTPAANAFGDNYAAIDFLVVDAGSSQTNKHIATSASTLTISVLPVNDAPQDLNIAGDLQVAENAAASLIGSVVFTDADANDQHQVTVSDNRFEVVNGLLALRSGVVIDHESEDFIPLQIAVTDSAGATTLHDFVIEVTDVNEAPVTTEEIESQIVTGAYSFTVPVNMFFDIDGDQLELSATQEDGSPLPSWLEFDPATGEFTVSESNATSPDNTIVMITATDPGGLTTSAVFNINIEPPIAAAIEAPITTTVEAPVEEQVEVVEEEETPPETEESDEQSAEASNEDLFTAASSDRGSIDLDQDRFAEVVQLDSASELNTRVELRNDIGLGVKAHNEFKLLTAAQESEAKIKRAQQELVAINKLSLKNLSAQADARKSEISNSATISTTVLATSTTVTSSLSVGYILWLLRGGTLLASMMASLPAWRAIDPLPILDGLSGDDENDTETLESMVESDEEPEEPEEPTEKS